MATNSLDRLRPRGNDKPMQPFDSKGVIPGRDQYSYTVAIVGYVHDKIRKKWLLFYSPSMKFGVFSFILIRVREAETMLAQDPIICIQKNCQSRLSKGATRDTIIQYLDHLKNDVWKFNPRIVAEIEKMKEEMKGDY